MSSPIRGIHRIRTRIRNEYVYPVETLFVQEYEYSISRLFSGILRLLLPLNHHNMRLRSFVVCISVVSATSLKGFGTHHVRLHFLIYRHLH
jgi:hypothetical protein